jgi:DNA polymerase elongation subunit (family B)
MLGRITWTDYTIDDELGVLVRASARMEDDSKFNGYIQGTEPYIFAPENEGVPDKDYIQYTEDSYESLFDHELQKIVTETPQQAGGLTDNFSWTGEGDVPYYRRVAIHDGLSGYVDIPETEEEYGGLPLVHVDDIDVEPETENTIQPRVCISDIEVHVPEEDTFDEMVENGSEPINVICCYDTLEENYTVFYYDKYDNLNLENIRPKMEEQLSGTSIESYTDAPIEVLSSDNECGMLNAFVDFVNDRGFDLISGWNFTDFDYEYIISRMETLNDKGRNIHSSWLSPFNSSGFSQNKSMKIRGLPSFDMMRGFCDKLTFSNWRSKSLEYVSNEELGIGKIDDVNINEDWENEPSKLIAYNIVDVILTVALDESNDIHNFFYDIADASAIPIYDTFYEKRLVDGYIMSRRGDDEVLPSSNEVEEVDNAGGYVENAYDGRVENVGVSDLKSLYPSGMITWNLSTETLSETSDGFDNYVKVPKVPEPKNVQGSILREDIDMEWLYASLDEEGIIPRTLKGLFKKRNYEKEQRSKVEPDSSEYDKWDRKQGATKVIMNSFYGVSSSPYWRLANEYLGDAVTSTARYTLWKGKQTIENLGYEGVYGDTDSHFIKLKEDNLESLIGELEWISEEMDKDASKILNDIYVPQCPVCEQSPMLDEDTEEYYCPRHGDIPLEHPFLQDSNLHGDNKTCMKWEPEKIYSVWMQLDKKKRYAGNIDWKEGTYYDEPKISISGFENQRSDSMPVTASLQEETIELILTGASFEEVSDYIQSIISEIDASNEDVNEFALPGSINKALEDYPNRQIPRASMYSNEHLGYDFGEGDDPFVYLVNETPPQHPNTDVVAFEWDEEIPDGFELDKEAIIERGIKKPIDTIINEAGWTFDEIRSGKKTKSMDFGGGNPFE